MVSILISILLFLSYSKCQFISKMRINNLLTLFGGRSNDLACISMGCSTLSIRTTEKGELNSLTFQEVGHLREEEELKLMVKYRMSVP